MVVFYRADMVYNQRMAVAQQRKCSCSEYPGTQPAFNHNYKNARRKIQLPRLGPLVMKPPAMVST